MEIGVFQQKRVWAVTGIPIRFIKNPGKTTLYVSLLFCCHSGKSLERFFKGLKLFEGGESESGVSRPAKCRGYLFGGLEASEQGV